MNHCRTAARILLVALALADGARGVAEGTAERPPDDLIRQTIANELRSADQNSNYMFRERKETPEGSQTKLFVQTREATVGMVVAYNDRPLSKEQRQGEFGRIQHFIDDPADLGRKRSKEKEDAERVKRILRALPDAFLYQYDGTEPAKPNVGKPGSELVRLRFIPNPKYEPPSHVEQVLTGMQGVILVDPQTQHLARIDGTLMKEVGFGWGILGHLDRGGHFLVDQTDVGDNNWSITRMELGLTGKMLLFKTLNIKSTEIYSDFHRVPDDLTFAQGAELLRKQAAVVAQNQP